MKHILNKEYVPYFVLAILALLTNYIEAFVARIVFILTYQHSEDGDGYRELSYNHFAFVWCTLIILAAITYNHWQGSKAKKN